MLTAKTKLFKKLITFLLKIATKIILGRKKPEIIAITGSAGKTTTKNVLREILSSEFEVLASNEGYNTEIGAPLVIFRERVPDKVNSVFAWIGILIRCYKKALFLREFPEKIILEMGADKPGDIRYLSRLFRPDKSIILAILPVHLESFKNIEAVAKEKAILAQNVKKDGKVFLNNDDPRVAEIKVPSGVQRITFGRQVNADFRALELSSSLRGTSFTMLEDGDRQPLSVRLYGDQLIYSVLAAVAAARSDHVSYPKIRAALKNITPTPGRMSVIEGIRGSVIIDDSYNANPESTLKALEFLGAEKGRRIAVLGNMNELGNYEREGHEIVGEAAAKQADLLITVGSAAGRYIAPSAKLAGLQENKVISFDSAEDAGDYLKKELRGGDVVLVKGSQNKVRLEKAIEKFMARPEEKMQLLARQSSFWQNQE